MNRQNFYEHCEKYSCAIDQAEQKIIISNFMNGRQVSVDFETKYDDVLVMLLCSQLGIPYPDHLRNSSTDPLREMFEEKLQPDFAFNQLDDDILS